MSKTFENNNSGTLGRNDYKTTENQPSHRGSVAVTCPHCGAISDFSISAWVREAKATGNKFFSLVFTPKDAPPAEDSNKKAETFDDDIPF